MKLASLISTLICTGCFLMAPHAQAATACLGAKNLVVNCNFGTGDFTGWTLSGTDVPTELGVLYGVEGTDPDGIAPHSGSTQAYFGDLQANATTISQDLATIAGRDYTISFYLAQDTRPLSGGPGYGNALSVLFGTDVLDDVTDVGKKGYKKYTFTDTASASDTLLSLTFGNDLGEFLLDDVSVKAIAPEPAAFGLIVLTGAILLLARRKLVLQSK